MIVSESALGSNRKLRSNLAPQERWLANIMSIVSLARLLPYSSGRVTVVFTYSGSSIGWGAVERQRNPGLNAPPGTAGHGRSTGNNDLWLMAPKS